MVLNLLAMCCIAATAVFLLFRRTGSVFRHHAATTAILSYTGITATLAHVEFLGGAEWVVRLFYALSFWFMAGAICVYLRIGSSAVTALYCSAAVLSVVVLASDYFVAGVIDNGVRMTRDPGSLYGVYLLLMLMAVAAQAALAVWRWRSTDTPSECIRWRAFALAQLPTQLAVIFLVYQMKSAVPTATAVDSLHICVIAFCAVLTLSVSTRRLPAVYLPGDGIHKAQTRCLQCISALSAVVKDASLPDHVVHQTVSQLAEQYRPAWSRGVSARIRGKVVTLPDPESLSICVRTQKAVSGEVAAVTSTGAVEPLYYDASTSPPVPVFFK